MIIKQKALGILIVIVLLISSISFISAKNSGNYDIPWHTIAGGGGNSKNSNYEVTGTIGQAIVGFSKNETYSVGSGFWNANTSLGTTGDTEYSIFLPIVIR